MVVDDPRTVLTPADDEPIGPDTYLVAADAITIHDPVHNVLRTYRNDRQVDSIPIPSVQCCADILVQGETYWLLSAENVLYEYKREPGANHLKRVREYAIPDEDRSAVAVEADGQNIAVWMDIGAPVLVVGSGPLTPTPSARMLKHGWILDGGDIHMRIESRYDPADFSFVSSADGFTYFAVYEWDPLLERGRAPHNGGYVYKITKSGQVLETFTLRVAGDKLPNRDLRVSGTGELYQMVITRKTTKVYRIEPNA